MTLKQRFLRYWFLREFKILLVVFLVVGGSVRGFAQTEFSEKEYRMFRSFYYDSFNIVNELAGKSEMSLSLEDFEKLPEESKRKVCSIVMDYNTYTVVVTEALFNRIFGEKAINRLTIRLMFDLAEVEWVPLNEVSLEDQPRVLEAKNHLKEFIQDNLNNIGPKFGFCLENWIIDAGFFSPFQFSSYYTSVPVEFRLREFYRSQLPFAIWVLENARNSEEKDRLEGLIESIKRKYLLDTESA